MRVHVQDREDTIVVVEKKKKEKIVVRGSLSFVVERKSAFSVSSRASVAAMQSEFH